MSLSKEHEAKYAAIIDGILAAADLSTISAKRIRKGIQAAVDYDITPEKEAITSLIMARFDKATERQGAENGAYTFPPAAANAAEPPSSAPLTDSHVNGTFSSKTAHRSPERSSPAKRSVSNDNDHANSSPPSYSSSAGDADAPDTPPPKKKHKKTGSTVEDDAEFARRLQMEENRSARSTRGGGAGQQRKKPLKKGGVVEKKKAKSATRLDGSDDSDLDSGSQREVKRTGGFHKPMLLSPPLSALLGGETQLSRPQCVKRIWEYVKARDLQDPSDKRQIRCDDAMRAVFKSDRVHMFTMNKILNQNLYAVDE